MLGGASYASFDHVGANDLTLSLGGVINYALLDGTTYSLPPTLYFSWQRGTFFIRGGGHR